jgi:hypothetical protein
VFMREGLLDAHHILQINVGPDSVFLFDYMEYSRSIENISTTTVMAPSTSTAQSNIECVLISSYINKNSWCYPS